MNKFQETTVQENAKGRMGPLHTVKQEAIPPCKKASLKALRVMLDLLGESIPESLGGCYHPYRDLGNRMIGVSAKGGWATEYWWDPNSGWTEVKAWPTEMRRRP